MFLHFNSMPGFCTLCRIDKSVISCCNLIAWSIDVGCSSTDTVGWLSYIFDINNVLGENSHLSTSLTVQRRIPIQEPKKPPQLFHNNHLSFGTTQKHTKCTNHINRTSTQRTVRRAVCVIHLHSNAASPPRNVTLRMTTSRTGLLTPSIMESSSWIKRCASKQSLSSIPPSHSLHFSKKGDMNSNVYSWCSQADETSLTRILSTEKD